MSTTPRCAARVSTPGTRVSSHQCTRKAVEGDYCKIHHPDQVKTRYEASRARFMDDVKKSPLGQLLALQTANEETLSALRAELVSTKNTLSNTLNPPNTEWRLRGVAQGLQFAIDLLTSTDTP